MTYLLDTSVIVNFLRGAYSTRDWIAKLSQAGSFAISVMTFGELIYGAHRSGAYKKEGDRIEGFLNDFQITVLPMTQEIIELYAAVKYTLERTGNKLDDFDLLIGATAVATESRLVTENVRHFRKFPGITVVDNESK